MAEEIIDLLAQIPGLKVIGRTSSFQFRDKTVDVRSIGSTLGAAYVLEGRIRKSAEKIRVTAQLIALDVEKSYLIDDYLDYLTYCRTKSRDHGVSLRDFDRALGIAGGQ